MRKRYLLPVVVIMTMILAACGSGKTTTSPTNAGGTTPTSTPSSTPTETPVPTETPTPTATPVPTMPGALSGFIPAGKENLYVNEKVAAFETPRRVIKLKDTLITISEDQWPGPDGKQYYDYYLTAHNVVDWTEISQKKLKETSEYQYPRRWLQVDFTAGENSLLLVDGGNPERKITVYDGRLDFTRGELKLDIDYYFFDEKNERLILFCFGVDENEPSRYHLYEYKYITKELNKLYDIDISEDDAQWLYPRGITDNNRLLLLGDHVVGDLDEGLHSDFTTYLVDIKTGEVTRMHFLDASWDQYGPDPDPTLSGVTEPDGKRCFLVSNGYSLAYIYDWGTDKRVDIKLGETEKNLLNDKYHEFEFVPDWKHNVLITYCDEYVSSVICCYSMETGELIASCEVMFDAFAIPSLDAENGLLFFYGIHNEDSEAPLVLYAWDYLGLNAE